MVTKKINNDCTIEFEGDMSDEDRPKMRLRLHGKGCPRITKEMLENK